MKYVDYSNKRKAVSVCLRLWIWLRDNPGMSKDEWPKWGENMMKEMASFFLPNGYLGNPAFDCPCCQYVIEKVEPVTRSMMPCINTEYRDRGGTRQMMKFLAMCPLRKIWKKGCCHSSSPFYKWEESMIKVSEFVEELAPSNCHEIDRKIERHKKICRENAQIIVNECRRVLKELPRP